MNAYLNTYQANAVATSSPERILIMLYDGAIRNLGQARQHLADGERAAQMQKISKTIAILCELSCTLDFEVGGEVAENLESLYHYMIRELTAANLTSDGSRIQGVETLLRDLRETWMQAIELARQEKAGVVVQEQAPVDHHKPFALAL